MSTPEEIQREIEQTRAQLSGNVDRLGDKVAPGKVVGRRMDSIKSGATSLRERVMGSNATGSGLQGTGSALGAKAGDLGSSVASNVGGAPQALRQQTQGNPLAVGVIAFGVGWLLSSTAPASPVERRLATSTEDKAKELAGPLKQTGQEMADNLRQPVQDSAQQLKDTATQAAQDTVGQAQSAAQDVKQPLQ